MGVKRVKKGASGRRKPGAGAEKGPSEPLGASADTMKGRSTKPSVGKSKSPYSDAEIDRFRTMLLEKREQLVGDVRNMRSEALRKSRKEAAGDLSSMPIHMADIGSDNYEQEFTLGLMENEETLLREIDEALARMENGTYGVCLATGGRIGKARLKLKPWAKYCVKYVRKNEKTENNGR